MCVCVCCFVFGCVVFVCVVCVCVCVFVCLSVLARVWLCGVRAVCHVKNICAVCPRRVCWTCLCAVRVHQLAPNPIDQHARYSKHASKLFSSNAQNEGIGTNYSWVYAAWAAFELRPSNHINGTEEMAAAAARAVAERGLERHPSATDLEALLASMPNKPAEVGTPSVCPKGGG